MNRRDLLRHLTQHGCVVEREGAKHTLYCNPIANVSTTVPRHREINTFTAKAICRDLQIPIPGFK